MPSSKFVFPANGAQIQAGKTFTIQMAVNHLTTGNFVNAASSESIPHIVPQPLLTLRDKDYFSAPQQVDNSGDIVGHSHVVIEKLSSLGQTAVTNPSKFAVSNASISASCFR